MKKKACSPFTAVIHSSKPWLPLSLFTICAMQDLQMADPFGVVNAKAAIWHLLSHLSPSSAEWVQKSQYHLTWRITPPPDQIPFPIPAPLRQAGEKWGGRLMWIEVIGKFLHGVYARVFDADILAIKDFNVKPH